jgi:ribosomal 30S subunit maturation factor RimM
MIPFVKEIVPIVDVRNKKVIVTEKEGLLDA